MRRAAVALPALILILLLPACASRLNEYYYLGTFDPESQLPQEVYRYRVAGKTMTFSTLRFASGWLPKGMVDPLDTSLSFDSEGNPIASGRAASSKGGDSSTFESLRPLYQFGPEGFRAVPQDHRFCIMMASDPSKLFEIAKRYTGEQATASRGSLAYAILERRTQAAKKVKELEQKLASAAAASEPATTSSSNQPPGEGKK